MLSMEGQFTDGYDQKHKSVVTVKLFPKNTSVNAELLFNIISKEAFRNYLPQVCSVMADTTSLNTGKNLELNAWLSIFILK